jgi:rhamnosyltransferase
MPLDTAHPQPKVSVAILTRNAGRLFEQVMDALRSQQTPWPFEVVVLDSASKDGTDRLAEERGAKVVPYRPAKFRFGTARDTVFSHCRGDVIVTISHDVVPANETWLAELVAPVLEDRADATIGEQTVQPGGYAFYWDYHGSWLRSVPIRFDQAYGKIAITCSNLAIKRSVWEQLRFGDCDYIEDRVLQVKLHQGGYRMMQVKALSYHGHDYTWKDLSNRTGTFALGWARLGWPYTFKRLLRDLVQPNRYLIVLNALVRRRLVSWKEIVYPVAMCFIQYKWSRKHEAEISAATNAQAWQGVTPPAVATTK